MTLRSANKASLLAAAALLLIVSACDDTKPGKRAPESPSAPYAVGSSTRFIHDEARPFDAVAGIDAGVRVLITELWYPVQHADIDRQSRRATYGDYVFGDRDVHRLMMTQTTFFHLTPDSVREGVEQAQIDEALEELFQRPRNSYPGATPAHRDAPWPVVVMSHGDAGSRYNMETVCEYLASHGYIVIAPEHTGNSPYAMVAADPALAEQGGDPVFRRRMHQVMALLGEQGVYGKPESFGQSYTPLAEGGFTPAGIKGLDQSLLQRVNDLRAALDELEQMNQQGEFAGTIDLERIGLMGRSFGGATTLAGLMLEDRFTAGMAVVPPSMPDLRPALPPDMLTSAGQESAVLGSQGRFALAELVKPTLLLSGAEDRLIIGLAAAVANTAGTEPPTPDNPHPVLRAMYEQTAQPVVWGLLANANHASLGVAGPYWWPQLKPDRFQTTFDEQETYTLVDARLAHTIQKELALAFFDLMIRQDASARSRLVANPWHDQGLLLEQRNL